jgi:hypothetical protein
VRRKQAGFVLFILPYVVLNLVGSVLALAHPLGSAGVAMVAAKLWLGYTGFFWTYMICFVWRRPTPVAADATVVPRQTRPPWLIASMVALLLRGVPGESSAVVARGTVTP